jgi:hypothetical protein
MKIIKKTHKKLQEKMCEREKQGSALPRGCAEAAWTDGLNSHASPPRP